MKLWQACVCVMASVAVSGGVHGQAVLPPGDVKAAVKYDAEFFPGAKYDANVKTPDSVLGCEVGSRPATPEEITKVVEAIAGSSPRAKLFEYGRTHEGRPLHLLVISSERNIARLDGIKADAAKLADGMHTSEADASALAKSMPAIAWMAYVIHGDEMSGSDAALAAAYHLAASQDEDTRTLLENVVVVMDPLMNPDGRARCLRGIAENRTVQPSVDDQSIIHAQVWPGGRMNHYLFDMNRDWLFCTQPETQGRVKAAMEWHPHYFVESHEQGSQDTFLFMPPRDPINPNIPANVHKWSVKFADGQAAAFDQHGWRYYTGEWNEEWYPGYSGSWGALRGAIDNLYEQAEIETDAVRRLEGRQETYREAVHKQLVSTMANLRTLSANKNEVLTDFAAGRRASAGAEAPYAKRVFAVVPGKNSSRLRKFTDLMHIQGISMFTSKAVMNTTAKDRLGRTSEVNLPPGTILIPNRQEEGAMLAAMMEFDPHMQDGFLTIERRELLRMGQSKLYDITGWSVPMLFDVDCYEVEMAMPSGLEEYSSPSIPSSSTMASAVAYIAEGADDASVKLAGKLMSKGVKVRVADKIFELEGKKFDRGSVVVTREDNPDFAKAQNEVMSAAKDIGITVVGVGTGLGAGDLPDLGGEHFVLLTTPRIAIAGHGPFDPYSYGEAWFMIDHELGLEAAYLNADEFGAFDLRRYNVLVLPEGAGGWVSEHAGDLKSWVEAGGTLIAIGSTAGGVASDAMGVSGIRKLPDVLTNLDDYQQMVVREWEGVHEDVNSDAVWAQTAPEKVQYPWWIGENSGKVSDEEMKRRDRWRALFMPQGALLAGRTDDRNFL
ncbi:MAG TPA: M14 family zinc carboxypeptidase, partial [Phycisphaerales bacterium]|nr:M14 family zinc carboxypeptidase [Phycisphaerales bacterium]